MTTTERDLLERIRNSSVTSDFKLTINSLDVAEVELMVNAIRKNRLRDSRWTSLERILLHLRDVRLIVKYAVYLGIRWEEAEDIIRGSDYMWNYTHFCLRQVPIAMFMNPGEITAKQIFDIRNTETKRVAIDLMGVDKFLEEAGATIVDSDEHPINGKRALLDVPGIDARWLVCGCPSTGRVYYLSVPKFQSATRISQARPIVTCEEADKWLCGSMTGVRQVGRT